MVQTETLTFEIITEAPRLEALRTEWDALWHRAEAPRLSQSFDWIWTGWRLCHAPRGRRLCVVTLRAAGRLVVVWPMVLWRAQGVRVAGPLGSDSTEYDTLLVEAGDEAAPYLDAAWAYAQSHVPADVLNIGFVFAGSLRAASLAAVGRARRVEQLPSPMVALRDFADWAAYWRSRKSGLRNSNGRRRRRLEELGPVASRFLTEPAEIADGIDIALRAKAAWMAQKGLDNHFIRRPDFRAFLVALASAPVACGALRVMVLELDGKAVAVKIGSVDGTRLEGYISTYDFRYDAYSPGSLMQIDSFIWCKEHGLDYDMRIGDEAYKADWATAQPEVTAYAIALTRRGVYGLWRREADEAVRIRIDRCRAAVPLAWRAKVKALLGRGKPATEAAAPIWPAPPPPEK